MGRFFKTIAFVLCLMVLPAYSWAQENAEMTGKDAEIDNSVQKIKHFRTAKDNFGGWFFGAEIMAGALFAPYDSEYLSDDNDVEVDTFSWPILTEIMLNTGYLWGEHVFVGPTLNVMGGFAIWVSVDLRVRVVVPFTHADAFALSVGYGFTPFNFSESRRKLVYARPGTDVPDDTDSNDVIRLMYVPVSLGYEHVFDSGFVIGASIDMRISFSVHKESYYTDLFDENNKPYGRYYGYGEKREKVVPYVSAIMGGFHMGYKF